MRSSLVRAKTLENPDELLILYLLYISTLCQAPIFAPTLVLSLEDSRVVHVDLPNRFVNVRVEEG